MSRESWVLRVSTYFTARRKEIDITPYASCVKLCTNYLCHGATDTTDPLSVKYPTVTTSPESAILLLTENTCENDAECLASAMTAIDDPNPKSGQHCNMATLEA